MAEIFGGRRVGKRAKMEAEIQAARERGERVVKSMPGKVLVAPVDSPGDAKVAAPMWRPLGDLRTVDR
jgi:hypothetical protein